MAPIPGILYVTMAPQPSLTPAQFHDWYQNEHGPGRLRLAQIFPNGFRYRTTDGTEPEWMAIYDVTDVEWLTKDVYTTLRLDPKQSQRERDTMKQIKVNRKFYDLVYEKKSDKFLELEKVEYEGKESCTFVAALVTLKDQSAKPEFDKWMEEEHIALLTKVTGFRRARRFISSHVEPPKDPNDTEYLTLYDYDVDVDFNCREFKDAVNTPWRTEIFDKAVKDKRRQQYKLYYTFGPAPRDLQSLSDSSTKSWSSEFHQTKTYPAQSDGWAAIESYVPAHDGVPLYYRLEGATDLHAPLIVLDNSILTDYTIWNNFVKQFLSRPENKKYRILRFNKRGRHSSVGEAPVTLDLLTQDIATLLDAFRVPNTAAVIGVSLGGATALNFALRYPDRVEKFIACDTNPLAPAANPKAWGERIEMAEKTGATSSNGETVVGDDLAEVTVRRWFVNESYDDTELAKEAERIKQMVSSNSLEGFRKGVKALYEYDLRDGMKKATVPGAFVVGAGDGVLPKGMKQMNEDYAGKSQFYEIPRAGHLPMVEQPHAFADVVTEVLKPT
jgi:pimeloyl-ACP methyl ester carboxylesterase